MPYVFDSAVTANVNYTMPVTTTTADGFGLVMGWWWCTTAASNLTLWHWGASNGAEMGRMSSTTALDVYHDTTSTNGRYSFASVISTGRWLFIAAFTRWTSSTMPEVLLWVGDATNAPTPRAGTLSNVGAGTVVTGTFGCVGSGINTNGYGWEGYACDVTYYIGKAADSRNIFGVSPSTAVDNANATRILNSFVMPKWRGNQPHPDLVHYNGTEGFLLNMPLANNTRSIGVVGSTVNGFGTSATGSGSAPSPTTVTANPRPVQRDMYPPRAVRRSGRLR